MQLARPASSAPSPDRERALAAHVDKRIGSRLRVGGLLIAGLVILGGAVAWITRPSSPASSHLIRGATLIVALGVWFLASRLRRRGHGFTLALVLFLATAIDLSAQILETGGASSPYFTGLCLLVIATGLFLPTTPRQTALLSATIAGTYLLPILWVDGWGGGSDFGVRLFFLGAAFLVALSASADASTLRRREFFGHLALEEEQQRSEQLLFNILPRPIADRLKRSQEHLADGFEEATILFADIVGFTGLSAQISPEALVALLNAVFSRFDDLVQDLGLEKIKTIGDAYMVAGGLPIPRPDHAQAVADAALAMQRIAAEFSRPDGTPLSIRIGINTGPVVAGVIGHRKFIYDLWGDAVNIASRMESQGEPGSIQVTEATYQRLAATHRLEPRGEIDVKGKGKMSTWFLLGSTAAARH